MEKDGNTILRRGPAGGKKGAHGTSEQFVKMYGRAKR